MCTISLMFNEPRKIAIVIAWILENTIDDEKNIYIYFIPVIFKIQLYFPYDFFS